jgi:glyoxylase-like metal-dependent hydrolase (beta-lactamase superfamily II)
VEPRSPSDDPQIDSLEVLSLVVGPFQSNCFLVRGDAGKGLIIDPGDEAGRIVVALDEMSIEPVAVLLTHAHVDHVGAVAGIVNRYGVPVYLHPADRSLYDAAAGQAAMFGVRVDPPPPPDHELTDGQVLDLAGVRFSVRHTPGHSPGGVVLHTDREAFVGDCVFAGSIGRTDLPGGDTGTLLASIREHILTLPPDTVLYTGHGPATTVQAEADSNPFLAGPGSLMASWEQGRLR